MSAPRCNMWVANECLKVCRVTEFNTRMLVIQECQGIQRDLLRIDRHFPLDSHAGQKRPHFLGSCLPGMLLPGEIDIAFYPGKVGMFSANAVSPQPHVSPHFIQKLAFHHQHSMFYYRNRPETHGSQFISRHQKGFAHMHQSAPPNLLKPAEFLRQPADICANLL